MRSGLSTGPRARWRASEGNQERAWEILRSVVIGLLFSCIASTAFGHDAGGGSNESPHPGFYVLGEISLPAEFPNRVGLNVVSAIAIAGGETNRANKSRVLIQHLGELSFKEYPLSPAIPVLPGDTKVARTRFLENRGWPGA